MQKEVFLSQEYTDPYITTCLFIQKFNQFMLHAFLKSLFFNEFKNAVVTRVFAFQD